MKKREKRKGIKGKGKGIKDQSIMKFLIRDLTLKEKTGSPGGNNKNKWGEIIGGGGEVVVGKVENSDYKLDTTSHGISENNMGGETGSFLGVKCLQQQRSVGQLKGRDTEICRPVGCTSKDTTGLDRSTTECTDQQRVAGPARQTEPNRQ